MLWSSCWKVIDVGLPHDGDQVPFVGRLAGRNQPGSRPTRFAARKPAMRWRWSNVPIPEAHLVALVAGVALHLFAPLRLVSVSWLGHVLGWPLIVTGLLVAGWAVWKIGDTDIGLPTKVTFAGPYAFSRNPMCVARTLMSLGLSLAANTVWPILFLLGALVYTHLVVALRE
jgi:protein-S-isoprenylcysteine O-methyltransferase Ste14